MNEEKNYRRNGGSDFRMAVFRAVAGGRMKQYTHWHEEADGKIH